MAREIVWTDPAWADLESAAEYIARDSAAYAATFVQEVKDAAASLAEFAERGQVVPELGDSAIREPDATAPFFTRRAVSRRRVVPLARSILATLTALE